MNDKSTEPQLTFNSIHEQERSEIRKRRERQYYDNQLDDSQPDLVGLALSGGGIRSATFCLGFLQELQRLRLLRIFDYLSTVSGGGYLGGWWSAWLSRPHERISESPLFRASDIHYPVSLLRRINEARDAVAKELRENFNTRRTGQNLLKLLEASNLESFGRLNEMLVYELNNYIDAETEDELRWQRRELLLNTFPNELSDIFPPREKIEPERAMDRHLNHKESDGSRCAWEDPIHHLRLFANYLTPRKGILSADTWRAITVVTRNLTLTWLILLPLLIGLMLLGQAYLLLNPTSHLAFTCTGAGCTEDNLKIALVAILVPISVLVISSVIMAIAWLLCNRDNSTPLDWMIQTACLLALAALLVAVVVAIEPLRLKVALFFGPPQTLSFFFSGPWSSPVPPNLAPYLLRLRLVIGWIVVLFVSVLLMWYWGAGKRGLADASDATFSSWKRDVRRGRFSRAQAKLLVITAVTGVVLLLSWFTCFLSNRDLTFTLSLPFTVPVLLSLAGSIFTAMRAPVASIRVTPAPNGDKLASKEPHWATRFIFAATPPLVVGVLAVAAACLAHWLILTLYQRNTIYVLLGVAALLSIGLCMTLAVYEMENVRWSKVLNLSTAPVIFIGLTMINLSWGGQAVFRYVYEHLDPKWRILLPTFLAMVITGMVFRRLIPRGKWKWRLLRNLEFVRKRSKSKNKDEVEKIKDIKILRLLSLGGVVAAIVLITVLTIVGSLIGSLIYLNINRVEWKVTGGVVLALLAVGGGLILFRLLVDRTGTRSGQTTLALRLPGEGTTGQRPEALWVAASICLVLPIVVLCVSHYLHWQGKPHVRARWIEAPMFFPLTVGLLLILLMILRSLVIQKLLLEKKPIVGWAGGLFAGLVGKIPKAEENPTRTYQLSALGAICLVSFLETAVRRFPVSKAPTSMGFAPTNWRLMAIAFCLSLVIFGLSIFQIPASVRATIYPRFKHRPPKWLVSKYFLWLLATFCVAFALVVGLLLPDWIQHISDIPLSSGLTPLLLPVASACCLLVFFEMYWSERDNRRTLWLIAFAYLAIASIFLMTVAGAGLHWHLVPGLLAAICVWIGALGWMVDPNAVSMHQFYKGRLVRAYLGASNIQRFKLRDKEITDTVAGDDLPLKSLTNCDRGGPYHLINTTLNLVAGRDLATAQRSASSFVLSQKYCGSTRTNYCLTEEYMNGQLTLGTAMAASGAAVSPNMGAKKPTAALAMLMTLLNVRLGYWAPTPNRKGWNSSQPRLWPYYLVREFLSQTNDLSDYCYLTDGGHFDNTGLYSLIERGCRYVVLVDCGADPKPCFEDLGEAIRRCRIDFGAEIDLCLEPFIKNGCASTTPSFVVGTINFSEKHLHKLGRRENPKRDGIIVYFKPNVIPAVSADVRQYSIENTFFPQQPTTNQWFGEAQFESYRRLGQACANSAFDKGDIAGDLKNEGQISSEKIGALFESLREAKIAN